MKAQSRALICGVLLFVSLSGNAQTESKPRRTVKGLPRYMTDIPQPIPPQIQLPDAPKTARDVRCFASFTTTTSMQDVVRKCGIPDEHQGSGIYIFLYDMNDGSVVVIGTADLNRLMYVNHITHRRARSLLHKVPDNAGARSDFSITLERVGCLGSCPDYTVTILGNGSVQYEGRFYVTVEAVRQRTIPLTDVHKLIRKLGDEDFFHWEEKDQVCLDFPEVHITATLNGQRKQVLEGCNSSDIHIGEDGCPCVYTGDSGECRQKA